MGMKPAHSSCLSVWLLDFARTAPPSARLDGFDISAEQFPCKELLPSNISFQKLDAFAPVPEHLIGVYDVVHIRLFNTIVRGDDASPLISNMIKMLSKSACSSVPAQSSLQGVQG